MAFSTQTYKLHLIGAKPGLIMHNGLLADPDNPFSKRAAELKSKKGGGSEVQRERQRVDFLGGLYLDDEERVIIPAAMLQACLFKGASKIDQKKGKGWALGISIIDDALLEFKDSDKTPEELAELKEYNFCVPVVISNNRVMKTRPVFREWQATVTAEIETDVLDKDLLVSIFNMAGRRAGLGDWRPDKKGQHGRFMVETCELISEQEIAA